MKVSVEGIGDFDVKDLTYREQRDLRRYNSKLWWNKEGSELEADEYFDLLEKVETLSGVPESKLKEYNGDQVDKILQTVLIAYVGDTADTKKK